MVWSIAVHHIVFGPVLNPWYFYTSQYFPYIHLFVAADTKHILLFYLFSVFQVSKILADINPLSPSLPNLLISHTDTLTMNLSVIVRLALKQHHLVSATRNNVHVFLRVERRSEIRSHVVTGDAFRTHCDVRCELTYLDLSTCNWITQDGCYYQVWTGPIGEKHVMWWIYQSACCGSTAIVYYVLNLTSTKQDPAISRVFDLVLLILPVGWAQTSPGTQTNSGCSFHLLCQNTLWTPLH